ncbi:MAG TPA: Asp-tRNA(Asn)/Glu-tRNA(Gln) amidotransferase subunit GatB [Woeseiaceae bacterium]|nr:Asp-tRNA(Asn)/Glu-tRNA(Gln) amidotransferase subunit GatB [Woeseiaceae bacterium]
MSVPAAHSRAASEWEAVIGLEIHMQIATASKIFSAAPTTYGAEPNTQASLIDLGYPGVLPVLNEDVVRMACKFGLAVNASIAPRSVFARKNYFYPDLPKGYQISQYELPIVARGELTILDEQGREKRIGITRAHLEEDAGKSLHSGFDEFTRIDLNRAGTPLLEIVSDPDLRSAKEAVAYMRKVHTLVRYLEISDGNMQEGSFRCDANVSIRRCGDQTLGTRTELKNLNSFRFVERAINFEIERQQEVLEEGGTVLQETRLYDSELDETRPMRTKEEANDYRYFPDPDLLPVVIEEAFIESVRETLPELPDAKRQRFVEQYDIRAGDAEILTTSRGLANYFEATAASSDPKLAANWILGDLSAALNREGLEIDDSRIPPEGLAELVARIADSTISGKIAKEVFDAMWAGEGTASGIIDVRGLRQITDPSAIEAVVGKVIEANPGQAADYRSGKDKLLGFFVGQVMKETSGKANPAEVNRILKERLKS